MATSSPASPPSEQKADQESATIAHHHLHTTDTETRKSESKKDALTFFDLPAEVRNTIYEYALKQDTKVLPGTGEEPNLFKTCHRVRDEASQMFYFINDLEFYIWPWQVFNPQNPVYSWAHYHIGGGTLQIGTVLCIRTNLFTMELLQSEINGKVGLTLQSIVKVGQTGQNAYTSKSICDALDFVFRNEEANMAPWLAHSVVQGLVQYVTMTSTPAWNRGLSISLAHDMFHALHFIGGPALGGECADFARQW